MNDARYAYHEAGHAVAAAVLGFAFRSSGIHMDETGVGVTQVRCPSRRCSQPFSALQMSQAHMVIVLFAGLLAQKKFFNNSSDMSAADDDEKIDQYLSAIYRTNETAKSAARGYFKLEAIRLVDAFENAIQKLGESLWSREYTPRTEDWGSTFAQEKTIDVVAVNKILREWDFSCKVDDRI